MAVNRNRRETRRSKGRALKLPAELVATDLAILSSIVRSGNKHPLRMEDARGRRAVAFLLRGDRSASGALYTDLWMEYEGVRRWCLRRGCPPWTPGQIARAVKKFGAVKAGKGKG